MAEDRALSHPRKRTEDDVSDTRQQPKINDLGGIYEVPPPARFIDGDDIDSTTVEPAPGDPE
jgi:hypothetical protein